MDTNDHFMQNREQKTERSCHNASLALGTAPATRGNCPMSDGVATSQQRAASPLLSLLLCVLQP